MYLKSFHIMRLFTKWMQIEGKKGSWDRPKAVQFLDVTKGWIIRRGLATKIGGKLREIST